MNVYRHLLMGNTRAVHQLFALMITDYIIISAGTFRENCAWFKSHDLQLPKDAKIGECKRLGDNRLGMLITRWLGSNNLQTVSTMTKSGSFIIEQRKGSNTIKVESINDVVLHQENMGAVDLGD